ncbi:hypothetical protein NGF19_27350 [Streptomyces sp. RY43-2]|uniref:Small CPxCG-related zinc finger protein n=1 Tax=Streptomyces macrolidinus TaxID=2952607 RepID=A0ABT0ZLH5_9ACTN|nr:hypothetical protein [Streptomyces macrolidinus]MCN9244454.1 hypothetical protein [Streptomyces macrolidinus]
MREAPPNRPAQPHGDHVPVCVHCEATADNPVAVATVHQNSGPGFTLYACQACTPYFPAGEGES